jgi:predicted Ser/Thr protein kinase
MPEAIDGVCGSCGTQVPERARFCSVCGSPVVSEDLPTLSSPAPGAKRLGSRSSQAGISAMEGGEGRFVPGTVLAGRYRIVALLGKGGMGEVYRAEDLTLGQPVALKFLPRAADSEETLERFRNEVKIARRVSHRNVCRVYDIGEAEGRHFLSMEYVEGEDLASLLKRIGRLPQDKAIEVARGVCAGLAAAHEKGVLHRDLKPANVMLDRQGQVVITDFGLAALAGQVPEHDARSGTPSYMAPEQLANGEVTTKSDLYALGLVLYEIFTGRRAFDSATLAGKARPETETKPSSPSSVVRDLDPAVEHAILWCLEREPERRPRSALAVAAALPGGDPLAAALEAGVTPAPEVVAGAGETAGLRPRSAILRLAAVVIGLSAVLALAIRSSGLDRIAVEPPDAMASKAREILTRLGYSDPPYDSASGYGVESAALRYFEEKEKPARWDDVLTGWPPLVFYWYRTSPQRMLVLDIRDQLLTPGVVDIWNPPATLAGMANIGLDARGRLNFLQVQPPEVADPPKQVRAPEWDALFEMAGLDRTRFQPAEPRWTSIATSDTRVAWTGSWPGGTNRPLRVEAAAFQGKVVYFTLVGPWTPPYRTHPDPRTTGEKAAGFAAVTLILVVMAAAILLARRNFVSGRGDRRGAVRLAAVVFFLQMVLWLTRAHHIAAVGEFALLIAAVAYSLFASGMVWLLYLSLEPYVRRHWPQTLISWSRVLTGRLRDPLVGRDLLSGVLLGLLWALIFEVFLLTLGRMGGSPQLGSTEGLNGGREVAGAWLGVLIDSIRSTLVFFLVLFLLRVLLRRHWLASLCFVALFAAPTLLASRHLLLETPVRVAVYSIVALAVVRFGLVTLAAGILTVELLLNVPATASLSSWYAGSSAFVFLSVLLIAAWGFWTSLGGQRFWQGDPFE